MMNTNFLRQISRQIRRHPLFYGLNLLGLGLGIACAFVLLSYVRQEWSYDRSIPDGEQIYRIGTNFMDMGGFAISQEKLQPVLQEKCQAVAYATRFRGSSGFTFEADQQTFPVDAGLYVDTNFFRVFPYEFIEGQAGDALVTPDQIVLTEEVAQRIFGTGPYLGKTLSLKDEKSTFSVAGIVRPFPGKTHLPAGAWLSVAPQLSDDRSWTSARYYTYVKLNSQSDKGNLEDFFAQLQREEIHPQSAPNTSFETWIGGSQAVHFYVQPLQEIYLYSDLNMDLISGGNPTQVWILGIIGVFILLMAGVNYVNLSTATASARAKEIGIKKTMGANQSQLIVQFLGESLTLSLLAMVVAGSLSGLLLKLLETVSGEVLLSSILDGTPQWLLLLGFSVLTGLLAGAYPAFHLSRFQPVWALKSDSMGHRKGHLRNVLVVFQFSIAAALMIGSLVIFRQLSYMQNSDKGFQHDNVLVIRNFNDLGTKKETLREMVEQNSQVVTTSINSRMPAGYNLWRATYQSETMDQAISLNGFPIDEHYLSAMDIKLLEGRNFSGDLATDTSNVILNESAVKALELEEPIGAVLNDDRRVIGVVSDFNFESFRNQIAPIVFNYDVDGYQLAIKLTGNDLPGFVRHLEDSWSQLAGDEKIRYYFLDDNLAELSAKEAVLSRAIGIFTVLALFIACLGLFGLTTHATSRRAKEIGVRKVLGATVSQIVVLLSRDFLSLVALAFAIGIPVAWILVNKWLQGFVYRIDLNWWMFAAPAIAGVVIAFLTLSYQSVSAALNNPAEVLKDE
ncbi:ABC transporter permease [Flavilitoribacter nigricans]|nr:FtsX-like permease family protein [Flavilitoribacter nigricans]